MNIGEPRVALGYAFTGLDRRPIHFVRNFLRWYCQNKLKSEIRAADTHEPPELVL